MPYTGNLVRIDQQPTARGLPAPSPRHALNEADPSLERGEHQVPSGTGAIYQGQDYDQVVTSGFGMTLNTPLSWAGPPPGGGAETPYHIEYTAGNPHDSRAVLGVLSGEAQWFGDGNRLRAHDGSVDHEYRTTFSPAPYAGATQERTEIDTDGLASPYSELAPPAGTKFVRGINSLPENNPPRVGYDGPGFRRGRERVRAWDNTVRAHISRVQGVQVLQPRDAYTPLHYPRMVSDMMITPALPRQPSAPDAALIAGTVYSAAPASVIGGF